VVFIEVETERMQLETWIIFLFAGGRRSTNEAGLAE